MSSSQLLDLLNEKTTKEVCDCMLKPVFKKYEQYQSYLPEFEQKEFSNQNINFQFAFSCLILNLKLRDKPKKPKGKKSNINTDIMLEI